jgi:peptidoglycan/LPS O-acetylase OafA/YrhL
MLFNLNKINKSESKLITLVKTFLLLQVIIGHSIALSLPKASTLNFQEFNELLLLFYKLFFSFGAISAYLFIFLSGYLTSKIFIHNDFAFIKEFKKRVLRIYPIFIIAIFLTIILDFIGMNFLNIDLYLNNRMNYIVENHYSLNIFILNFLSLQPTFVYTIGSNGPLWTLGYLVQFFILGLVIKSISKSVNLFFLIGIVVSFFIGIFISVEFFILFLLWIFGIYFRNITSFSIKMNSFKFYLVIFLITVMLTVSKLTFFNYQVLILSFPLSILLIILIKYFSLIICRNKIYKKIVIKDYSYELYVFHMPLLFFILGITNLYTDNMPYLKHIFSTIIVLILCIYISKLLKKIRII